MDDDCRWSIVSTILLLPGWAFVGRWALALGDAWSAAGSRSNLAGNVSSRFKLIEVCHQSV
jgi:hypothetical protein